MKKRHDPSKTPNNDAALNQITPEDANRLWCEQESNWDCWLAALQMSLAYCGYKGTRADLVKNLLGSPLRISKSHGAYITYCAFIAGVEGYRVWLECPIECLPELKEDNFTKHIEIKLNFKQLNDLADDLYKSDYPRFYLYKSLALICERKLGQITVYKSNRPTLKDIQGFTGRGIPVLAFVSVTEFYGLCEDDSGHVVTFIPVRGNPCGYVILDPYRERGFREYGQWARYLENSNKYDWSRWSNWLVAITSTLA